MEKLILELCQLFSCLLLEQFEFIFHVVESVNDCLKVIHKRRHVGAPIFYLILHVVLANCRVYMPFKDLNLVKDKVVKSFLKNVLQTIFPLLD